jgi:NSS family neurotransmitter:Na+ symporter
MDTGFLMSGWEPSFGHNFFDTMDYLASNWMLPLGGLFIAIYAGWVMPRHLRDAEIADSHPWVRVLWLLLCRFVSPALVLIVLLQKAGFIDADAIFHHVFH